MAEGLQPLHQEFGIRTRLPLKTERRLQSLVIINLAIKHQHIPTRNIGVRLIRPRIGINDTQTRMPQANIVRRPKRLRVRTTMCQGRQNRLGVVLNVSGGELTGYAAH